MWYKTSVQLTLDDLVGEQILHKDNLPKPLVIYDFLKPLIGKTSLVTVTGDYWRNVRKVFNPAFAASHLETLVPGIIEESMVFVDVLEQGARSSSIVKLGKRLPV